MSQVRILQISDLHLAKNIDQRDFFDYDQISSATFIKKPLEALGLLKERWCTIFSPDKEHRFAASYSPAKLRSLKVLIRNLRNDGAGLDTVIITGDIATTGLKQDLTAARNILFVTEPTEESNQIEAEEISEELAVGRFSLNDLAGRIHLLPGNHDRYELKKFGSLHIGFRPGNKNFHEIFADCWNDDAVSYGVIERDNFVTGIFGADFGLNGYEYCESVKFINGFAQGNVLQKTEESNQLGILGKLIELTERFKSDHTDKNQFIVWAIHFTPDNPRMDISPSSRLLNSEILISEAEKRNVSLILSGHIHKTFETPLENTRASLYVAGSATQYFEPKGNSCQLITIKNDGGKIKSVRTNYKYEGKTYGGSFI